MSAIVVLDSRKLRIGLFFSVTPMLGPPQDLPDRPVVPEWFMGQAYELGESLGAGEWCSF